MPIPANTDIPVDTDLPCPKCGYDLRGSVGTDVRCPECFAVYARETLPEAIYRREMQRFPENPIATAITAFLLVLVLFLASFAQRALWFAAAIGSLWVYLAWRFRDRCCTQRGWLGAIIAYDIAFVVGPPCLVSFAAGAIMLVWLLLGGTNRGAWAEITVVVVVGGLGVLTAVASYRWASRRIDAMRHQCADRVRSKLNIVLHGSDVLDN